MRSIIDAMKSSTLHTHTLFGACFCSLALIFSSASLAQAQTPTCGMNQGGRWSGRTSVRTAEHLAGSAPGSGLVYRAETIAHQSKVVARGTRMAASSETERLAALRALRILDSPPEEIFDSLTRLAALSFKAPIALVSLVDQNRQWFKSCIGLDVRQTDRDVAFCDHAIRGERTLVVPDATADPRFRNNPLVTGDPSIRFYAGAPLISPDGDKFGTLCIIDVAARHDFGSQEIAQRLLFYEWIA